MGVSSSDPFLESKFSVGFEDLKSFTLRGFGLWFLSDCLLRKSVKVHITILFPDDFFSVVFQTDNLNQQHFLDCTK